ncbi:LytTR family DNA-binding domain-containing protein [Asticcacaulis sp. BYS171W]|uniref:LytTR family DNA-binding domain-containing protein n=1 Tax=Asticcacaulis aquaticus TaxID=2984212 RepID=A0ABT5HRF5_9CAUL|nr:LytTR family DNA-binding domain-containing protein [Asticcacaulis aquaticus]MDC7682634.1 LytTR family DNA-binding domain-containing protein [Asticcacaulis aquaticus]
MRETGPELRETTPPTVHASSMAHEVWTRNWKGWSRATGVAIGMGVFLSLIGAFGTGAMPLWHRLIYWVPVMTLGTLVAIGVEAFTFYALRARLRLEHKPLPYALLLIVLLTPAITLVIWLFNPLFGASDLTLSTYIRLLTPVAILSAAMTGLNMLINREPLQSHAFVAPVAESIPSAVAFLERLPFKHQRADIYAISAEDHYLRVHTSAGNTMILMRLYDAIRELEGIEGSQTHRSWWVARDAITDIRKQDGKVCLVLKGDLEAPVSRSFQKALRADGWV